MTATDKAAFELSADSRFLYQRLAKAEVGEVVAYSELSNLIGRKVQGSARHNMMTAVRLCQKDGFEFAAVTGVGLKRLAPNEIVTVAEAHITRSRNAAKRGLRRLANADFEKLNNAERLKHNTVASALGALSLLGKPKSIEKIEAAVTGATDKLPVGRVLELFRS